MTSVPCIHVLSGGPFHPVAAQFDVVARLLGDHAAIELHDGAAAFDDLDGCDLLVLAGLHWTGMEGAPDQAWPEGVEHVGYVPPNDEQRASFEAYVASGRPVLAWHGGTGSFDDWPEFGRLLGFQWVWGTTAHSPIEQWVVEVGRTGHPVVEGVDSYEIVDELYYDVAVAPGLETEVHASADYDGAARPMVVTGAGGRVEGAGKTAFLANGHDLRALDAPGFRQVIVNTIDWLLEP